MTLSSRHRIRISSPGGLRPSTLPLGHGGSPEYWRSHVDGEETFFVSFKPPRPGTEPRTLAWKAAVLTSTLGSPPSLGTARWADLSTRHHIKPSPKGFAEMSPSRLPNDAVCIYYIIFAYIDLNQTMFISPFNVLIEGDINSLTASILLFISLSNSKYKQRLQRRLPFQCGDVYGRQVLTSKFDPRTSRIN